MTSMDRKHALQDELVEQLAAQLEVARTAHRSATEGATHADARPENDKDTRGLEQSYLARGQARRVQELEVQLAEVEAMTLRAFAPDEAVAVGALVRVEEGDAEHEWFLAPHGGGISLAGGAVQVVTPRSPLGAVLLGRRAGDDCELRLPGKRRELVLITVR